MPLHPFVLCSKLHELRRVASGAGRFQPSRIRVSIDLMVTQESLRSCLDVDPHMSASDRSSGLYVVIGTSLAVARGSSRFEVSVLASDEFLSISRLPNKFPCGCLIIRVSASVLGSQGSSSLYADQQEMWIAGHLCGHSLSSVAYSLSGGISTYGHFGDAQVSPEVVTHACAPNLDSSVVSAGSVPAPPLSVPALRHSGVRHPWTQLRLRTQNGHASQQVLELLQHNERSLRSSFRRVRGRRPSARLA